MACSIVLLAGTWNGASHLISVAGSALPCTVVTKAAVPSLLELQTLFTQRLLEGADCGWFVVFLEQCVLCWRKEPQFFQEIIPDVEQAPQTCLNVGFVLGHPEQRKPGSQYT